MGAPIKITLYDSKTNEVRGEYEQRLVTFEMLVKASQLKELLEAAPETKRRWWWIKREETTEERQINAMMELVAEFFNHQFTAQELRHGADVSEVMAVLRSILSRASEIVKANPTPPPQPRPKKGR